MHHSSLITHNRASLLTATTYDTHSGNIARLVSLHAITATHGGFYAYSDSGFNEFDNFNDLAFQCIEAQTFGYSYDGHNGVMHIIDAIPAHMRGN